MEAELESVRTNAGRSSKITNFTVYLPNKTSVDNQIDRETCQRLDVITFIDLLRKEQSTSKLDGGEGEATTNSMGHPCLDGGL